MNPRFEAYRATERGRLIEAIARKPEHAYGYELLSRLGIPAVVAISWDVAPILAGLPEPERRKAKQYCGAVVGDIMRERGYEIINPRGSARGSGVFTHGAVWGKADTSDDVFQKGMDIAEQAMKTYRNALAELAK